MRHSEQEKTRTIELGSAPSPASGLASGPARDPALDQAREYLHANRALWDALGIADGSMLEPRYLGVGEHNLNYRFGDPTGGREYVLRINVASQPFHDNQVAYEFAALRALESSRRVPAPLYLDDSPTAPGKGALVIGFCEGDELDFDHLRPGDLQCAAQLMADIHAVPIGRADGVGACGGAANAAASKLFRPRDPLRDLFDECVERFELYRASAWEDARITRWAESFIAAAERTLDTPCDPADCTHIINTEPLPSHFLIPARAAREAVARTAGAEHETAHETAAHEGAARKAQATMLDAGTTGRLCDNPGYFIDWERPIIGEVAQDLGYFVSPTTTFWDSEYLFPSSQVEAFVEDYWRAVDGRFPRGNFDARFRAFRMMTALRSVTWCCRALITYGDVLAATGAFDKAGMLDAASASDAAAANGVDVAHTTSKTVRKLPVYLSDDFMEMLAEECFGL